MIKYTTIRLSLKDKKRLEKLSKLMGSKSLAETLRYVLDIAEREFDKCRGSLDSVLSALKYSRDIGETNAEDVNRYLYGEE